MRNDTELPSPLLKWVGGKSRLMEQIFSFFPEKFDRYFEPFAGGAAVFFRLNRSDSVIADLNGDLTSFYQQVGKAPEELKSALIRIESEFNRTPIELRKDWHKELRSVFNTNALDPVTRASIFLALNKTSFNGLFRENARGEFNVPFNGLKGNLRLFDESNFARASRLLSQSEIVNEPYDISVSKVSSGDLVYFDPPYVPISPTSSFTAYNKKGFSQDDQMKLAQTAAALVDKGAKVVLSNSLTPWVCETYGDLGFTIHTVEVMRGVSAKASSRGTIKEALIVSR